MSKQGVSLKNHRRCYTPREVIHYMSCSISICRKCKIDFYLSWWTKTSYKKVQQNTNVANTASGTQHCRRCTSVEDICRTKSHKSQRCSLARLSLLYFHEKGYDELVPSIQRFISNIRHYTSRSHLYQLHIPLVKSNFHSNNFFSRSDTFDSQDDASETNSILNGSIQS